MSTPLDLEIKTILELRRGEWPSISENAKVSYSWLSKFVNGHIPNPGYATLQRLKAVLDVTAPERMNA